MYFLCYKLEAVLINESWPKIDIQFGPQFVDFGFVGELWFMLGIEGKDGSLMQSVDLRDCRGRRGRG